MDQKKRSGDLFVAGQLAGAGSLPLLTTKLYRSPISPDLMQHTRLMGRLIHNRHRLLALIAALALSPAHQRPWAWGSISGGEPGQALKTCCASLSSSMQSFASH